MGGFPSHAIYQNHRIIIKYAHQSIKSRRDLIVCQHRLEQYRRSVIYTIHAPDAGAERVWVVFVGGVGGQLSDGIGSGIR